jgi:hypothetical protein
MTKIAIESGRLVIKPVRPGFRTPMIEFCIQTPFNPGVRLATATQMTHPRRKDRRKVTSVTVAYKVASPNLVMAKMVSSSQGLVVGDATYIYVDRRSSKEYGRAVAACKKESQMIGSYRTDDGQIAIAVRLGDKECVLDLEITREGGLSIVRLAQQAYRP